MKLYSTCNKYSAVKGVKKNQKNPTTASWNFHTQAWLWLLYDCCTLTYHWLCSFHWVYGVFQLLMVGRCNSSLFEPVLPPVDAAVVSLWLILALLFSEIQGTEVTDSGQKKKNPYSFRKCLKGGWECWKTNTFLTQLKKWSSISAGYVRWQQ